jgi:NAD(P)-dependent dehydrogenase (short-subunit alcohol dehydrogenase family)
MHVVITGANRGIGHALMSRYASRGDQVTGTSRAGGDYAQLDVTDENAHKAFAASLTSQPVDLLICNAGVYLDKGHALDTGYPADAWADTFAANVTGVFLTVQSLLPNLRMAKNAKIAIISSQMASHTRAPGGSYIYRASKAAALNLGRNLSSDLASEGIAVGIYHPGWVSTDMGGAEAPTTVDQSADGLVARFDELDLSTTGCFRTFDGADHAY